MRAVLWAIALVVTGLMVGLLALLILRGAEGLSLEFLFMLPRRAGREDGILPVLVSTALLVGGALGIALPIGVGTALYLQEYKPPQWVASPVRTLTEALSGVPSIIFGLFGFSLFVIRFGWGWSLASGSATLALMLLPTVIRTAEEALAAVPAEQREGAAALGASRWMRIWRILLPQAAPGMLTGAILATGRALGETAAVMLTAGTDLGMPTSPFDPGRSLAVHLYIVATEGLSETRSYTTALLLAVSVLAVNLTASLVMARRRRV